MGRRRPTKCTPAQMTARAVDNSDVQTLSHGRDEAEESAEDAINGAVHAEQEKPADAVAPPADNSVDEQETRLNNHNDREEKQEADEDETATFKHGPSRLHSRSRSSDGLSEEETRSSDEHNQDGEESEDEETLVVLELADFKNHPILDDYRSITIEGIDTATPTLHIGEYSLHGQLDETVGTHFFYDTKNRTDQNAYSYTAQATKKIKFTIAPPNEGL